MKIIITEDQYNNLVETDLTEEKKEYSSIPKKGCETYVPKLCDPYSYLKVVDGSQIKYYFKKEGTSKWIETKNPTGINAIQTGVTFNTTPEVTSKLGSFMNRLTSNNSSSNSSSNNGKIQLKKDKLKRGEYTYDQIKAAVNAWVPKEDVSWGNKVLNSDKEYRKADWNLNVSQAMNKIHNWRNKIVNSLGSLGYSKTKRQDIENKLFYLTGLINDKYEAEHKKRWKSFFPES